MRPQSLAGTALLEKRPPSVASVGRLRYKKTWRAWVHRGCARREVPPVFGAFPMACNRASEAFRFELRPRPRATMPLFLLFGRRWRLREKVRIGPIRSAVSSPSGLVVLPNTAGALVPQVPRDTGRPCSKRAAPQEKTLGPHVFFVARWSCVSPGFVGPP